MRKIRVPAEKTLPLINNDSTDLKDNKSSF